MSSDRTIGPHSPFYIQLRELLRSKIENGEYPPGTAIPSVGTLAATYGIHRLSVRSAISALVGEGLLTAAQGKGFFVTGGKLEHNLEIVGGFRQNLLTQQSSAENRVLTKILRPAGAAYGALLNCSKDTPIYYVKQVTCVEGEPVSLEENYVPQNYVPNLNQIDLNLFSISQACEFQGHMIAREEQTLEITRMNPMDARLLDIDPSRGVMVLSCISYTAKEETICMTRTYTHNNRCTFGVSFQR